MTTTEDKVSVSFLAEQRLKAIGEGYVSGRIDAGDLRLDHIDGMDFGDFYAAKHSRVLDLPELYAEFVAQREEQRAAEEANDTNDSEGESQ